jgi:hypothetical protein
LDWIRSHIPGFRPPQSYMFIGEGAPLLDLLTSHPSNGAQVSRGRSAMARCLAL